MGVTIRDNSPAVIKQVTNLTIGTGLIKFMEKLHQRVQNKAPVDTGNHKGSIQWVRLGKSSMNIFSSSGYGGYLEFGTSRMTARPHFQPGMRETIAEFQAAGKWK